MQLTSNPQAAGQPLYTSQAYANNNPPHALGEKMVGPSGACYRFAKAGAVDLVAGNWLQSPAQVGNHQNLTATAAAIGATQVTVTLGATAATANQYAGGKAVVTVTPGLGQEVYIVGHPAAGSGETLTLTISEPLRVAWTTSTRVDLVPNQYNGVIQSPVTTLTGVPVGVAVNIITAGEYGWILCEGLAGALIAGTPAVGSGLVLPGTAAGAAVIDAGSSGPCFVGIVASTGGDGECNGVMVKLG
jgi:hypothetical protein